MRATEHKETGEKIDIYEVGYLVVPTMAEDKVTEEVSSIRALLEKTGATILAEDFPKLRPLAYTMERSTETKKNKFNEGYFGWIKFELPVASISNIKKDFDKRPNVIRHLIIKTVRENTMYSNVLAAEAAEAALEKAGDKPTEGAPGTPADSKEPKKEIDQSIDALVIA